MGFYRAQAVFAAFTGIPADAVVNSFHITTPTDDAALVEDVAELVRDFYVAEKGGQGDPVANYLGHAIADVGHQIKMYKLAVATGKTTPQEGAPPVHIEVFDFVGRGAAANGLPSEVAVCLSYKSDEEPTVPMRQKRGRIYIGPLKIAGVLSADATRVERPNPLGVNANLIAGAVALRADLEALGCEWVIYSRPYEGRDAIPRVGKPDLPAIPARDGSLYRIDHFWVDDAFDTVRRRGQKASSRLTA